MLRYYDIHYSVLEKTATINCSACAYAKNKVIGLALSRTLFTVLSDTHHPLITNMKSRNVALRFDRGRV